MRFRVIDLVDGEEPDLVMIALHEDWAQKLIYCDMEGFFIDQDGNLYLADECGQYAPCPPDRFKVEWVFDLPKGLTDALEVITKALASIEIVK